MHLPQARAGALGVAEGHGAAGHLDQGLARHHGQRGAEQRPETGGPGDVAPARSGYRRDGWHTVPRRRRPTRWSSSGRGCRPGRGREPGRRRRPASDQSSRLIARMPRSASTTGRSGTAPVSAGDVEGVREERVGAVEITVEQVGDALGVEHRRPVRAGRVELVQGELGVDAHLRDTAAAEQRPQIGQRRGYRVAVRERLLWSSRVPPRPPTAPPRRPAEQRHDQGAVRRDPGVVLSGRAALEPRHPADHRVDPAAGPHGLHLREDESGDPVRVVRGHGVVDGGLRHPVRLEPPCRPSVQPRDEVRFAPPELGAEQLPEEAVVAVPLAAAVERDGQEVAALQLFEDLAESRSGRATASHRPPHMRSRIDVRVRKVTSSGDSPSRSSDRR